MISVNYVANIQFLHCEGRDACEDGRLLHLIAGAGGNKAGDALDVPLTILTQTVQRTSRVSLKERDINIL